MRTSFRLASLLVVTLLAACGGSGTGPSGGALDIGILSGQGQSVRVGSPKLPQPVVGKLVRRSDGSVAFERVDRAADRLLDLVVPRAYAQGTTVQGSPVAGAVVCAVPTSGAVVLTPFTPCTNTGSDGTATFFFTPGTKSGAAETQIRGTVEGVPAVFDTVRATVTPGDPKYLQPGGDPRATLVVAAGQSIDLHVLLVGGVDSYDNQITPAELPTPRYAFLPPDPSKTTLEQLLADQSATAQEGAREGWTATAPAGAGRLYIWSGPNATATVRKLLSVQ